MSVVSFAHYDGSKNHKGFALGKDAIPVKVFESTKTKPSQYERDLMRGMITNRMGLIDGSLQGLIKTLDRLKAVPLLPEDKVVTKVVEDAQKLPREVEIKHNSHALVNQVLKAQIACIESMIKLRLGRKKEGQIDS